MKLLKYLFLAIPVSLISCNDENDVPKVVPSGFTVTIENVSVPKPFFESGVFNTPIGESSPAPLFPGDSYEFMINAGPHVLPGDPGTRLSFVTMFVQSNDLFFAPDKDGIPLYDDQGDPIGESAPADVTDQVYLWDAGTEVNETTGGPSQKPQQAADAEDVGSDENGVITEVVGNLDVAGNMIPDNNAVIKTTIEYIGDASFKVRIENVSDMSTIEIPGKGTAPVPLSPGTYAVHTGDSPFFVAGEVASEGVENIAEDGFPEVLTQDSAEKTGLIVPLSPGAYAIHEAGAMPFYMLNSPDFGEGLEGIAEDGIPTEMVASLLSKSEVSAAGAFNTAVGGTAPGAIGPGGKFEFSIQAFPGDRLSLATMFVQSNDWFYAFSDGGLELFNGNTAVNGDVSSSIFLYDAGTESDETPGAGLHQVIRQGNANDGADDPNNLVRLIKDEDVPPYMSVIKVTITTN